MKTYKVSDNPPLKMTQAAVDYMRQTLTAAPGGKRNIILVIEWAAHLRKISNEYTSDLDELRKTISSEDYQKVVNDRYNKFGVNLPPQIIVGGFFSTKYPPSEIIDVEGVKMRIRVDTFPSDMLAQKQTIDAVIYDDSPRLELI